MDSYSFHFERMSNVDLHPLSLPVSRLSPAKSSSSIVDQLAHHQHGKGDSAYSSFSGGSTAPDYPSPFLPDDLQTSSFSHYADLKYVKSIYNPTPVLQSDSKTMDQLYCSVEAISQQYYNNTNANHHSYNGNDSSHNNNKALKQESPLVPPSYSAQSSARPPPVPARLDSFITTKNLENTRGHHHGTEFHPHQTRPHNRLLSRGLSSPKLEMTNPNTGNSNFNSEPVYSVWRGPQHQPAQTPPPPSYRPHLQPHDQNRENPEYLFIADNKVTSEQPRSATTLSRSPPKSPSQPEHLAARRSSGGCNTGNYNKHGDHFKSQRKRAHSAHDQLGGEPVSTPSPGNSTQNLISSSIQHKGQFYFVTGVCKLSESALRTHSASVSGSEGGCDISNMLERHRLREKERSHSTMDNLFLQETPRSSSSTLPGDRDSFSFGHQEDENLKQENHRSSLISSQTAQAFSDSEESDPMREIGRHTASNPIFYCGPDRNCLPQPTSHKPDVTLLISNEQANNKGEDQTKREKRQNLGDVAREKINKETTPLLYHLTGASRTAAQSQKESGFNLKGKEVDLNKASQSEVVANEYERPPQSETCKNNRRDDVANNTLDDSFKKYYREKLKDAQRKVLRATSFKRRDLQLSLPLRVQQKPELKPVGVHCFSSSQDSETSTDTLTPSIISEEPEKGSVKDEGRESQKLGLDPEKENGKPANVAQPQVARIGGRKRLTAEQKKMCYSEPEKLNQLGSSPSHFACRSFGNESDSPFAAEYEGEEHIQHGEQGLVATRRQMFETRGRALSASGTAKTNLKHLQHKALVEYMERKTGHKMAEPQQQALQLPPPPRQRHSLGEKPFDWSSRPLSGNHEGKNLKKKQHRPHSAGRILDSSYSSIRYAQFFSAQSCSGQYTGQQNPSRLRTSQGPAQGKSASVESLLDQPEPPSFFRNRSTSIPHAFQTYDYEEDPPNNAVEMQSPQTNPAEESALQPAAEPQQRVRVVAQRGKSMEELGTSKLTKLYALSRSSEQLDQLGRHSTGLQGAEREEKSASYFAELKEAQRQESGRKKQAGKELENTQGQNVNQTQKKGVVKQSGDAGEDGTASLGSHANTTDEVRCSRAQGETSSSPPSTKGQEVAEREIGCTASTPTQTKLPCESTPCSRAGSSPSVAGSEKEQTPDVPSDSTQEVSLSCGVTTDPSSWLLSREEETKKEDGPSSLTDLCDPAGSCPPKQTKESAASPPIGRRVNEPNDQETEKVEEKMEDRGTPEGETESAESPVERPKWEELVEAVVKADQSLARVLFPLTKRKTALMLMEQLLSEDTLLMEEHYKKKQEQKEGMEAVEETEVSALPPASDGLKSQGSELLSKADVNNKKLLLASYIEERLRSLEESRSALQTEVQKNAACGEALAVLVGERCLPVELERYNLFIGDLERVVGLLLCLSARLARVQNALSTVDQHTDAEEKESLDSRHRLLCKQREDAKDLKDNLDRRENQVSTFLSRQLSAEQLQDYRRFVQTKASLLIRQKDLEEKQKVGEEQLEALSHSLKL